MGSNRNTGGKQTKIMAALIYVIVFAVLNLIIFLFIKNRTNVFWMSYAFMVLAFAVQIGSMLMAFRSVDTETVFMGIPLASLSFYYFFAATFTAVVFMIFSAAPVKLAAILQILILAAYLVVAILALMGRNAVENVNETLKENVVAIRTMDAEVDTLIMQVADPTLKRSLQKLQSTIRYSDPMSNSAVTDIEQRIMQNMNALRVYTAGNQNQDAIQVCQDLEVLFVQRNNILAATK